MRSYIYILSTFLFLFFTSSFSFSQIVFSKDLAPNYVTVINQVRGESCCSEGSIESTETQLKNVVNLKLPTTFVVRYDAMKDPRYRDLLRSYSQKYPKIIKLGVMVEIIPDLANDALVPYFGTSEDWFQAQYAFTIGYQPHDRQKLIEHLMTTFHGSFGYFPTVTSAWMIETETANSLHEKYGVKAHQITREQWGTDSYTLYGGPPHYPYSASKNWIFLPTNSAEDTLTVMRQTITDPLYNYGDTTSAFTSQPNDYVRDGKSIEYFKELFTNAMQQPEGQSGFALLGLENSMSRYFQDEYTKQLDYIRQNVEILELQIVFADDSEMLRYYKESKINIYTRSDGSNEASFITTPNYRLRLISNGGKTAITDIRVYSDQIQDPYSTSIAKYEGFWIAPFLLDGSRWYKPKETQYAPHYFIPVKNDFRTNSSQIDLGGISNEVIINSDSISFQDKDGNSSIYFREYRMQLPKTLKIVAYHPSKFPANISLDDGRLEMKWMNEQKSQEYSLQSESCLGNFCEYKFQVKSPIKLTNTYFTQYPYLFPEPVGRVLSDTYSRVSIHNRFAIAGRNPVRIILEPHDKYNFPIILNDEATITSDDLDNIQIKLLGTLKKSQFQYVDFYSKITKNFQVEVKMIQNNDHFESNLSIYFAPNCKASLNQCLSNPIGSIWYVITKISDWWNKRA